MNRIGIVSSYDESCGNAAFTRVLVDGLSRIPDVKAAGVGLNLRLTGSIDPRLRKAADQHIGELAEQLRTYDAVNIQFESQLYGRMPNDILARFKLLLNANKNTSVTMHSPRLFSAQANDFRVAAIRAALRLKLKTSATHYMTSLSANRDAELNRKVMQEVSKANRPVIVHTKRSEGIIRTLCQHSNVHTHPLQIVDRGRPFNAAYMDSLKVSLGLPASAKTIGIFGYISPYKGHDDAIRALGRLPKDYVLLVFGRQHPASIASNAADPFLMGLVKQASHYKLRDRVFFLGELSDDDFATAAATVDVCWMPYHENGQDGSGIASISFDVAQRVICSNSFAFDELLKLMPYTNYMRFDIGNDAELASKTIIMARKPAAAQQAVRFAYSIETQSELYARLAGFNVAKHLASETMLQSNLTRAAE